MRLLCRIIILIFVTSGIATASNSDDTANANRIVEIKFNEQSHPRSSELSNAIIDDIIDIEIDKLSMKKSFRNKFAEVLPPEKLLRLMIVVREVEVGIILKFISETPLLE